MSDYDYDDRCDDEQREADIEKARAKECMQIFGVPYDPYDYGEEEEDEEEEA